MKKILFIILLICTIQLSSATDCDAVRASNGYGTYGCVGSGYNLWYIYADAGSSMYIVMTWHCTDGCIHGRDLQRCGFSSIVYSSPTIYEGESATHYTSMNTLWCRVMQTQCPSGCDPYGWSNTITISPYPFEKYNVSGNICGTGVKLYIKLTDNSYNLIETEDNTSSSYSFEILNNSTYKLVFDNGHEYEFTCDGSDVQYDYDICTYMTIQLFDDCSNLLINPFTVVYDASQGMKVVYQGHDNPISIDPADVNTNDELIVVWTTWQGASQSTCYVYFDHPANIYDQQIYWDFQVDVFDDMCYQIENALVIWDQDCIINGDEYPKRNGFTDVYGNVKFTLCENDDGLLTVEKQGYKTLDVEVTNSFDVYTKNYGVNVFLEPDNSSEESNWTAVNDSWNDTNVTEVPEDMPDGVEYTMLLYFKNQEGHRISSVLDNASYVRCFYAIKYPATVNMALVFERSINGLGYTVLYTYPYSIDNNSCGYMWINNTYFSDPDYIYRAHIYDQTDEHIGRHAYLRVVAAPEEQNYTAYAIFSPDEPVIDYREYIKGRIFANTTSGSLPDLSLELYDETDLIEYFNYTQSDFDNYGFAYWLLGYNYTLHHSYTLLLKNDDGDIVSTAYTYAEDMRGNKLTVKVIDPSGNPLDHSYIFLKDYGRIPTNEQSYGTFEGLANQDYYYKAEKGGYRSTGWDMVSPVDEDTLVTYTLIPESPVYQNKMAKTDVKKLYYPFMYILLIIMLVGGLIHVFN